MSWDSRLVVITVLTFAIYGVANWMGEVGSFLPPLVVDFAMIPMITMIFLFGTKPAQGSVLIFLYLCYALAQAFLDPSFQAVLINGYRLDDFVRSIKDNERFWTTISRGGLVMSMILYAAMSFIRIWENEITDKAGRTLFGAFIFFVISMTVFAFLLEMPDLRNASFVGLGIVSILILVRNSQLKIPTADKRFLLVIALTFLLDLMQMLSLATIRL